MITLYIIRIDQHNDTVYYNILDTVSIDYLHNILIFINRSLIYMH